MIKVVAVISLSLIGCKESPEHNSRRVVAGKYVIEEVARDESLQSREIDIRWIYKDSELPIGRLFVHEDLIITLSPTPTQSDAIGPVGNYAAIGHGRTKMVDLYLHGSILMEESPYHNRHPLRKQVEISLNDFVESHRDNPPYVIRLTIGQATPYSEFLKVFESLAHCSNGIGLAYVTDTR